MSSIPVTVEMEPQKGIDTSFYIRNCGASDIFYKIIRNFENKMLYISDLTKGSIKCKIDDIFFIISIYKCEDEYLKKVEIKKINGCENIFQKHYKKIFDLTNKKE